MIFFSATKSSLEELRRSENLQDGDKASILTANTTAQRYRHERERLPRPASHILTNEGILDSFGHVSARSAKNPDHFFMPRAMPPALVSRADIVEVGLDCKPVDPNAPRLNGERYIHCEVYHDFG
jgi:hypothetical protein